MPLLDLSVVIPVFNKAREVQACLDRLKEQSLSRDRWEVIVVDDGSTDGSVAVAEKLCQPLIHTIVSLRGNERGAARARNFGARSARGKILIFLDPDVLPCRELLSAHLAALSSNPNHVSLGYMYAVGFAPSDYKREVGAEFDGEQLEANISYANSIPILQDCRRLWANSNDGFQVLPCPWAGCWSGNLALWASEFSEAEGFDEEFRERGAEDVELGYRLHRRGMTFLFNREAQGFHFPHPIDDLRCRELDTAHYRMFLNKHPALEVELTAAFSCSEVNDAIVRLSQVLPMKYDPALTWSNLLQLTARIVPSDARVCFFGAVPPNPPAMRDSVVFIGLTEWLHNLGQTMPAGNKCALAGMATPFQSQEFDCAVLIDSWACLPVAMTNLMLVESARIAHDVVCVGSNRCKRHYHNSSAIFKHWIFEPQMSQAIEGICSVFSIVSTKTANKNVQINLDGLALYDG